MLYSQAEIIKHHRELKGMTQSQLAEGICSRFHIVKAEAGTRKLSDFVFRDVLLKLGLNPSDFSVGIGAEDKDTLFLLQMEEALKAFDYSAGKERAKKIKNDISNYLSIQKNKSKNDTFWKLLVLLADFNIYLPSSDDGTKPEMLMSDILKARECSVKAIELFRPDFDLEKIDTYFLTKRERALIIDIATTYSLAGETQKEIEILERLKNNLEKNHKDFLRSPILKDDYLTLLSNIGMSYKDLEMWEKCLQHNEYSINIFLNAENIRSYAICLDSMAMCLMRLGRINEGKECYKRLLMFFYGLGSGYEKLNIPKLIAITKGGYEKDFGDTIDISEEW